MIHVRQNPSCHRCSQQVWTGEKSPKASNSVDAVSLSLSLLNYAPIEKQLLSLRDDGSAVKNASCLAEDLGLVGPMSKTLVPGDPKHSLGSADSCTQIIHICTHTHLDSHTYT